MELTRAGRYITQVEGYSAFIPAPLPPAPPIAMDPEMWALLSQADRALGRLDGATDALPNPDLFVFMYVRKEAVLSSQIEGTQASLIDILEFESQSLHSSEPMPTLIKVGLAHAQFETIHPFLDGNGRAGRLLITFLLCEQNILQRPLLYLSYFFKQYRSEYYDRLQAIRDTGNWEG